MATIRVQFVRDGSFSRDGHTAVKCEAGSVHDVPEAVARSLIEGARAVPVTNRDDLPPLGGTETRDAETVLKKHSLSVRSVVDLDEVKALRERHAALADKLSDTLDELKETKDEAERLRSERVESLAEGGDGPSRETVREAEGTVSDLEADVDDLRAALDDVGNRLARELDKAHRQARQDARSAHEALLRKAVDRARKFEAILDDLTTFENAYSDRIRKRIGGVGGAVETWLKDARKLT